MKKLFTSIILSCCMTMANAQIANGFYHVKNAGTGRYISINVTDPANYEVSIQSGSVNLMGIRTYLSYDTVAVSPSCVIFIKQLGDGKYDLAAQGSSLYAMTDYKLPIDITPIGNDKYKVSGTAKGFTKYLNDRTASKKDAYIVNTETGMDQWYLMPINTTTEYIGIRPDVKTADGSYYGTIFAGYNFRLASPGMTAFYVSNAGGTGFTMEQITDEVIPASTPVIIKCNSANVEDNKIEPVIGGYEFKKTNWLAGEYCSIQETKARQSKAYDPLTMRVLGLNDKGELAFTTPNPAPAGVATPYDDARLYKNRYVMANRAYLKVNPGDANVMTHGGYGDAINTVKADDNTSTGIYTLTGVRLPDGVTPRAGIYIKNGKKVIIK